MVEPGDRAGGRLRGDRIRGRAHRVSAIGKQTYAAWRGDRTHRLGAGLAFYALFTVVPFFALTAALAEWLFGTAEMQIYFAERLEQIGIVDGESAGTALTAEFSANRVQSSLGLIGLGSLLFASSLFFVAFTDAVNVIWKVPVGSGVWNTVQRRLIGFLMVLATGGVLIAGLAVSTVAGAAQALLPDQPEVVVDLAEPLASVASWVALSMVLALLFRFLTPVRVRWGAALLAGLATAVLLTIGTVGIAWYLRTFGGSSVAGAFGAVLAILTWIYYEAQILLSGVQLVKVLTAIMPDTVVETGEEGPANLSRPSNDE